MISVVRTLVFAASAAFLASCSNGGSDAPNTGPADSDARRAILSDIGAFVILPTLRALAIDTEALATAAAAWAASPGDAAALNAAQAAWATAMANVQRAEVFQLGPAASLDRPGGMDLRSRIYSYPLRDLCAIHEAAYAGQTAEDTLINATGMGALEYLLFSDADNPDCPPPTPANAQALRASFASVLADAISMAASELRFEWEPSGDNFIAELRNAGRPSAMTYDNAQDALDDLTIALFYAEKETKDRKIAVPTGVGATGMVPCPTVSCPERAESPFAAASGDHILANLQAFRDVFTGASGGMGLNDLLIGLGRDSLATILLQRIDDAIAAAAGVQAYFDARVAAITDNEDCVNAVSSRSGPPEVCALLGEVDVVADTLRADITAALGSSVPDTSAGDND